MAVKARKQTSAAVVSTSSSADEAKQLTASSSTMSGHCIRAQAWGAEWMSSESFLEILGHNHARQTTRSLSAHESARAIAKKYGNRQLSNEEIQRWLTLFDKEK